MNLVQPLLLVQMARRLGATVFATGSTAQKCAIAIERGAHQAMLYDEGRFAERIREAILEGSLSIAIEGYYTLDDVQEVHARIEAREQIGKSVMCIDNAC
ncbi:hypothetical protein [Pseudomonas gingeri]|uniref:hypothetical protein n=1 Tax=Pseudomonas gingeri TaxID=117681 RepID=UPI00210DF847|nr:hypothetical protein [Pseudomonas gingeri]